MATACANCKHSRTDAEYWRVCTCGKHKDYFWFWDGQRYEVGEVMPCQWVNHGDCPHWEEGECQKSH